MKYTDNYKPVFPDSLNRGMSLRDYFAAKAMQTMCSNGDEDAATAHLAYRLADAMLAEREKDHDERRPTT